MGQRIKIENNKFCWWHQKLLLIEEKIYNSQNTIIDSQKIIIFNHIYQHCAFHIVKDIDDYPVSMNVKIQ